MKSYRLSTVLLCAAISVAAIAAVAVSHAKKWADTAVATCRAFKNLVLDGFALASPAAQAERKPMVWFVQAKAFTQRMVKRERPQVSGSWRMCPST